MTMQTDIAVVTPIALDNQLDLEDEINRLTKLAAALAAGIRGLDTPFDCEKEGLEAFPEHQPSPRSGVRCNG